MAIPMWGRVWLGLPGLSKHHAKQTLPRMTGRLLCYGVAVSEKGILKRPRLTLVPFGWI